MIFLWIMENLNQFDQNLHMFNLTIIIGRSFIWYFIIIVIITIIIIIMITIIIIVKLEKITHGKIICQQE